MYRRLGKPRLLHQPDAADVIAVVPNRRTTLFASLTGTSVTIWNVRPSCMVCSASRTTGSIRTYGHNKRLEWSHDGTSLIILTEQSYLLTYTLHPLSTPNSLASPFPRSRTHARSSFHGPRQPLSQHETIYKHPHMRDFPPGAGEGEDVEGWRLDAGGVGKVSEESEVTSLVMLHKHLLLSLSTPNSSPSTSSRPTHIPQLLRIPYPIPSPLLQAITSSASVPRAGEIVAEKINNLWIGLDEDVEECEVAGVEKWDLGGMEWWRNSGEEGDSAVKLVDFQALGLCGLITSTGTAYAIQLRATYKHSPEIESSNGHTLIESSGTAGTSHTLAGTLLHGAEASLGKGTTLAYNHRFAVCAVGMEDGTISLVDLPTFPTPATDQRRLMIPDGQAEHRGAVQGLAWTSDGHALAVAYENGTGIWDVGGHLLDYTAHAGVIARVMSGSLFWGYGNTELYAMSARLDESESRLLVIPFGRSLQTLQPDSSNLCHPMYLSDDKIDVCQIANLSDEHILSPEAQLWRSVKIPMVYIATNWPIRHASISPDGKLLAVAGTNGLTHFSVASGRWKLFGDVNQEAAFGVQGGMVWYHHVLIAGVESSRGHEIRLYSRDLDLTEANCLHTEPLQHPILLMTIVENNLLVYSADNSLTLYAVQPTKDNITLEAVSRISFKGIVPIPRRVRAMSWIMSDWQREFGDPGDDLVSASIVLLIDSRLVVLRPRKTTAMDLEYDMHVLATGVTTFWHSPVSSGFLGGCIWATTEQGLLVWLRKRLERSLAHATAPLHAVKADISFDCPDMVPIAILPEKGLLIGLSGQEVSHAQAKTQLLLPKLLRYTLKHSGPQSAVDFAGEVEHLPYFPYALEVLLHEEVERFFSQDSILDGALREVVAFIDHFDCALDVLAACLRKMEMQRWSALFEVAGQPRELFEHCITSSPPQVRTAASYLLMLRSEGVVEDAERVIEAALIDKDFELVQDVIRFTRSLDASGTMALNICRRTGLV